MKLGIDVHGGLKACVQFLAELPHRDLLAPRRAASDARRKLATDTPGTATGYWKLRNMPRRARS